MNSAQDIINFISQSKKKTTVKVYVNLTSNITFNDCFVFGDSNSKIIFGEWEVIEAVLKQNNITDYVVENNSRNSAIPLLNTLNVNARIEPGSIIRDHVQIGDKAVIMMGAIINIGASIGEATMIDMGAIVGGRAIIGKRCHIGAGAVVAGVIEPPSATPVIIEDDVMVGANAVIIEGVRVGRGAVVAAGAVVINDVEPNTVVGGIPARVLKVKDDKTIKNTEIVDDLRKL